MENSTETKLTPGTLLYMRGAAGKDPEQLTVSKVGRKYFEVKERPRAKFEISTMQYVSQYSGGYQLYRSRQEVLDIQERTNLLTAISNEFRENIYYGSSVKYTLEDLREIAKVLKINKSE